MPSRPPLVQGQPRGLRCQSDGRRPSTILAVQPVYAVAPEATTTPTLPWLVAPAEVIHGPLHIVVRKDMLADIPPGTQVFDRLRNLIRSSSGGQRLRGSPLVRAPHPMTSARGLSANWTWKAESRRAEPTACLCLIQVSKGAVPGCTPQGSDIAAANALIVARPKAGELTVETGCTLLWHSSGSGHRRPRLSKV